MSGFIWTTTAMVIGTALLSLAAAGPTPANFNVHKRMTVEEIRQVFQTDPHTVPEYEVTAIHWPKLHKRAAENGVAEETATHIRVNAFGRDIPLWLHPIDGILAGNDTPVYHARADGNETDRVRLDKIANPMSGIGRILEDKEKKATLLVKEATNGRPLVFGNIGSEKLTIRPLPIQYANLNFSVPQILVDYYLNVPNITIVQYPQPHYHVVYKTPATPGGTQYTSPPISANFVDTTSSRSKRSTNIPSVIYPQILVVVDYGSYQRHNNDTNAMLEYLLLFWNAVDLRYRGLQDPKVRLNIAGVIIEAEPNTLSYIQRNKVNSEKLDVYSALVASGSFRRSIESTFPLNSSDVMVTMSSYLLCNAKTTGCPTGTSGLAYVGGACRNPNSPHPHSIAAAVIQDYGGFDGVHAGAHELGHLFSAVHDTTPGGSCSLEMGYIMSQTPHLMENSVEWSPCTLNAFDKFFRLEESACLFNKPLSGSPMPRVLPGRLHTMDDQCMKIKGTSSCMKDPRLPPSVLAKFAKESCVRLRCYDNTYTSCMAMTTMPADGSICGEGMICLYAKCIRESELSRTNDTKRP